METHTANTDQSSGAIRQQQELLFRLKANSFASISAKTPMEANSPSVERADNPISTVCDAVICSSTEFNREERLAVLALKYGLSYTTAQESLFLSGDSTLFRLPQEGDLALFESNTLPLRVILDAIQLSPEPGELYIEGALDTILPPSAITVTIQGDKADYGTIVFQKYPEPAPFLPNDQRYRALKFRTRIPSQGFRIKLQVHGEDAPCYLNFPDDAPMNQWKSPYAYENAKGLGMFVATPDGMELMSRLRPWATKRRLLALVRSRNIKGIDTLHFWEKAEKNDAPDPESKNRFILGVASRPAHSNKVNLDFWKPDEGTPNLGDHLSLIVTSWMLERRGLSLDSPSKETYFLAAIGSILGAGGNDSVVWGSGLLWGHCPYFITPETKQLDIRALRGPETKRVLEKAGYCCPNVFGDPAIVMPLIYQPKPPEQKKPHAVINHMFDSRGSDLNIETDDFAGFLDKLVEYDLIISSSLHGIILAEAYGIPAILLDDYRPDFSLHKYKDWYYSTDRKSFPVARSIDEALSLTPPPLPELDSMREKLMEAFPYDLWK